jgi:hypothetical protein
MWILLDGRWWPRQNTCRINPPVNLRMYFSSFKKIYGQSSIYFKRSMKYKTLSNVYTTLQQIFKLYSFLGGPTLAVPRHFLLFTWTDTNWHHQEFSGRERAASWIKMRFYNDSYSITIVIEQQRSRTLAPLVHSVWVCVRPWSSTMFSKSWCRVGCLACVLIVCVSQSISGALKSPPRKIVFWSACVGRLWRDCLNCWSSSFLALGGR